MAWPATLRTVSDLLGYTNGTADKCKQSAVAIASDSSSGTVARIQLTHFKVRLDELALAIAECQARSGFQQYARDQFGQQGLNTNAELTALGDAQVSLLSEVNSLLALGTDLSTAQMATFRTLAAAYAAQVSGG